MGFSNSQMYVIEVTERVCSVASLLGAAFIITTFIFDRSFHKPINRLVFFAAWGNIMSNVATIISVSGVTSGVKGPLCQFQAFLVQWFMPADALWTFAMAINVYLTFFRKYDAKQLRKLEWKYILFCYGIPFIPAFVYFFVNSPSRGKVYGSAVLWCWVSLDWDFLRVATFYGPVWVVIIATVTIYICALRVVLDWRRQLIQYAQSEARTTWNEPVEPQSATVKAPGFNFTTETEFAEADGKHVSEDISSTEASSPVRKGPSAKPGATHYERDIRVSSRLTERRQSHVSIDANSAAISYCKCAMLFFVALLVTWVPSTINRVVTLVHPEDAIFGLNYASGLVLPLQGFWNAIIYIFTSLPACQALIRRISKRDDIVDTVAMKRRSFWSSASEATSPTDRREDCSESMQGLRRSGDGFGRTV